jgi:hypothetical protein
MARQGRTTALRRTRKKRAPLMPGVKRRSAPLNGREMLRHGELRGAHPSTGAFP